MIDIRTSDIMADEKLILSKVRVSKRGQRTITVPQDDTTLVAGDPVKIEKVTTVN